MKQKVVYGAVVSAALLFVAGGAAAISAAAKPAPEAVTGAQITPQNVEEQKQKIEAIPTDDLDGGMELAAKEGQPAIASYFDGDGNIYTYASDGSVIGIHKAKAVSSGAALTQDELMKTAQLYLESLTDNPDRYTLVNSGSGTADSVYDAAWQAYCCGYRTTDVVSVDMNPDGTLVGYLASGCGKFDDVTVTYEQIEAAREQAKRMALPEGDTDERRIKSVQPNEDVVLTVDEEGNLCAIVTVSVERRNANSFVPGDGWYGAADDYFIPLT